MNRLKLWVFTLVAAGAAFLALRSAAVSRRADAIAALDARLASAAAHVAASFRSTGREAAALAAVVARDQALVAALRAPEPAPAPAPAARGKHPAAAPAAAPAVDPAADDARQRDAARAALAGAEKVLGLELRSGSSAVAVGREALARKPEGAAAEGDLGAFLRTAAGGTARRGWVRQGGVLYGAAAMPAGDGGAVAVLVPFDEAWAKALGTAAGTDVTVIAPDVKGASTARAADAPALQAVTKQAGAADAGQLTGVDLSVGPLKLPHLPQPMAGGWSLRARAVPLENVKGGFVVVSVAATPASAPAAFLWWSVLGVAVFLLASLVLGFFIRSTEGRPQVPEELLAAAVRIEKGDFAARVPPLAGKFGTVGAALNKAAEIAGPAQAAHAAPEEWFQQAAARVSPAASVAAPVAPVAAPGPGATAIGMPAVTAAAMPAATATAMPAAAPRAATGMLSAVSAPVAGAPLEGADEEAHWQQVFQDFLRTRASCGEPTEGLAYEKFRVKLEGNKAQLVQKYGCKTVRFQVYVKEGKAALKATPLR
jgi:hypothetical protein